jgi:hypothetical protein
LFFFDLLDPNLVVDIRTDIIKASSGIDIHPSGVAQRDGDTGVGEVHAGGLLEWRKTVARGKRTITSNWMIETIVSRNSGRNSTAGTYRQQRER